MFQELINGIEETLFMVFTASLITVLIGFPLSIMTILPLKNFSRITRISYKLVDIFIRLVCTIPYIVVMIALIPITHWLMDTQISTFAAVIPLSIAGIPLFTKTCVEAFKKIPKGLLDAATSLGANTFQLVVKVLIPESLSNIIYGFTQVLIQLIAFAVIVGVLGAGGIGKLLLEKGYQDYETAYVLPLILTIVMLVTVIQYAGRFLAFGSFTQVEK
jgi:D-methionine transport system permease protein